MKQDNRKHQTPPRTVLPKWRVTEYTSFCVACFGHYLQTWLSSSTSRKCITYRTPREEDRATSTEHLAQNIWWKSDCGFWDIRADKKIHSLQYSAPVCQKVQLQNTCNICSYYLRISAHRLQRISEPVDVCVSYKQPKSAHFWDSVWSQCSENVNALFMCL